MSPTDTTFVPLTVIPGLNDNIPPTQAGIALFLNNLYIFAIGIAVVLAIGMIIYGGALYALSEVPSAKGDGRRKITQALFGLVLVLAPALVFGIINPKILELQVNFEPLQTAWGTYAQAGYTSNDTPGVGGSDAPRPGQWCYKQQSGKYACYTSQDSCNNDGIGREEIPGTYSCVHY